MKKLINSKIKKETDKAYLIQVEIENESSSLDLWFPKSMTFPEKFNDSCYGDIYVEDYILDLKNEEIGAYILSENY